MGGKVGMGLASSGGRKRLTKGGTMSVTIGTGYRQPADREATIEAYKSALCEGAYIFSRRIRGANPTIPWDWIAREWHEKVTGEPMRRGLV